MVERNNNVQKAAGLIWEADASDMALILLAFKNRGIRPEFFQDQFQKSNEDYSAFVGSLNVGAFH